MSDKLLIM